MLVDGRTVPGLSVTPIRGESGPTMLEGDPVRHDDEVVLGVDTADRLGVGSATRCRCRRAGRTPVVPRRPAVLRVVGLATFAAISQQGADEARLGVGALVTRPTFEQLLGSDENLPEWTTASLAEGTNPTELIDSQPRRGRGRPRGRARGGSPMPRPAELLQLDEASPVLAGAIAVAAAAARRRGRPGRLVAHPSQQRRALGAPGPRVLTFPARRTAAWQAVPPGLAALVIGVPLGIAVGRLAFSAFARSIAVVDDPSSPPWLVVALALAVAAPSGSARPWPGRWLATSSSAGHPPRRRRPPRLTPAAVGSGLPEVVRPLPVVTA